MITLMVLLVWYVLGLLGMLLAKRFLIKEPVSIYITGGIALYGLLCLVFVLVLLVQTYFKQKGLKN